MTVWYHQSTILKCKIALRMAGLIAVCVAFITTLFLNSATYAAPGINQTLSFQGRLLTSAGGVVADGYYNMRFRLFSTSSGGSALWTETHDVAGGNFVDLKKSKYYFAKFCHGHLG